MLQKPDEEFVKEGAEKVTPVEIEKVVEDDVRREVKRCVKKGEETEHPPEADQAARPGATLRSKRSQPHLESGMEKRLLPRQP